MEEKSQKPRKLIPAKVNPIKVMLETGIRGWVCHSIYQNAEADNKDMKELYLQYWDVNNLYG